MSRISVRGLAFAWVFGALVSYLPVTTLDWSNLPAMLGLALLVGGLFAGALTATALLPGRAGRSPLLRAAVGLAAGLVLFQLTLQLPRGTWRRPPQPPEPVVGFALEAGQWGEYYEMVHVRGQSGRVYVTSFGALQSWSGARRMGAPFYGDSIWLAAEGFREKAGSPDWATYGPDHIVPPPRRTIARLYTWLTGVDTSVRAYWAILEDGSIWVLDLPVPPSRFQLAVEVVRRLLYAVPCTLIGLFHAFFRAGAARRPVAG